MQSDYEKARREGERAYRRSVASGQYPYLPALDSMGQDIDRLAVRELGVKEIPLNMIAGTRTVGRQNAFAGKVFLGLRLTQGLIQEFHDTLGFFHAPFSRQAACEFSRRGFEHHDAALAQNLQVLLGCGVRVHVEVHRRRNHDGGFHRHVRRQQHVVGHSCSHLAYCGGGNGRDEHEVCPLSEVNVAMP